jgi:soluble lytic murein transglycosylase-like protein
MCRAGWEGMEEPILHERRKRREPPPEFLAPHTRAADQIAPQQPCLSWYCKRAVRVAGQAIFASVLLVGGTLYTVRQQQLRWAKPGEILRLPAALVAAERPDDRVQRVARVLRNYTKDSVHAERVAKAIIYEGGRKNIDPALLIGVLLTEDVTLTPTSRSFVGARGLMQVMPFHAPYYRRYGCSSPDLFNVEANICHGVAILAEYMGRTKTVEKALLRYNGCVRGANTPNCFTYPNKVLRYSRQAAAQMLAGDTRQGSGGD